MKVFVLTSLIMALAAPSFALDFDGSWKTQKIPLKGANVYTQQGASLAIQSDQAVSILYHKVGTPASSASWKWEVTQSVPATNLRKKGGEDRNLAVYFVFMPTAEAAAAKGKSVTEILKNPAVRALVYTYGGADSRGTKFVSPYGKGHIVTIVKAPAGTGSGSDSVDLVKDYKAAFGEIPETLFGVAVSADSDDTGTSIRAKISNLQIK